MQFMLPMPLQEEVFGHIIVVAQQGNGENHPYNQSNTYECIQLSMSLATHIAEMA